ncbi:GTPase [Dactylosporangium vinaceum]|uniref:GTPase n=1 Tax=Dactylosporangium vinaceum TaxID=53362 RepID=A0ABV5MCZ7_9ACTN
MADAIQRSIFLEEVRRYRKRRRKPAIMICGGTGIGKTTTINTACGREVGVVGHLSRGTEHMSRYRWGEPQRHIVLVDVPGLGDSKERDQASKASFRRWARAADAFIVVVTPPRPASLPTLRTVKALLKNGVRPDRIVFGFNRLTMLNVEVDGELHPVAMGATGPVEPESRAAVEHGTAAFIHALTAATGVPQFRTGQVVPYDALTGWNVFPLLGRALGTIG